MGLGDMGTRAVRALGSDVLASSNGNGLGPIRRFGIFEIDLRAGELRRNDFKIKLQEQPFQILSQLLDRPERWSTREDYAQPLWPADTFVDFDHSLNAAIRRLRDALGDSAENPLTFVETVARRGYRFLSRRSASRKPSRRSGGRVASDRRHPGGVPSRRSGTHFKAPNLRAMVDRRHCGRTNPSSLLACCRIFLAPPSPVPLRVTRLTANPVDDPVRTAAISRDGRYLAYSDDTGFFLRQVDTGETHAALPAQTACPRRRLTGSPIAFT